MYLVLTKKLRFRVDNKKAYSQVQVKARGFNVYDKYRLLYHTIETDGDRIRISKGKRNYGIGKAILIGISEIGNCIVALTNKGVIKVYN